MKEKRQSVAPPQQDKKTRNLGINSIRTRPGSIAVSEIQKIDGFERLNLETNDSQDSFDTHDESRKMSLPQIGGSAAGSASAKNKNYQQMAANVFKKQSFLISKTQRGEL